MTPKFAQAVDPVFEYVLGLLARIDRQEAASPEEEQGRIRKRLDEADAKAAQTPEWKLAKYALVCWIDEVLIEAPWTGAPWWAENILERQLFRTRLRNQEFYRQAGEAAAHSQKDALEVFYLCVVLGFRGLYEDPIAAPVAAEGLGLPPQLQGWVDQTAAAIRARGRSPLHPTGRLGPGAPPLERQSLMIASLLAGSVLGALVSIGCWYVFILLPSQQ
jgi:type VI secretion system protein ImpK